MLRRMLAVLVAVTMAGCTEGDEVLDASRLQLELVSGGGQTAVIALAAGYRLAGDAEVLPDPIVVRVTDDQGNVITGTSNTVLADGAIGPTAPSAALKLPPNTLVRLVVPDSFGEAAIGYGAPDDTGYVRDRWVKGTKAGEACMDIRLLVRDSLITREAACNTFLPGPLVQFNFYDPGEVNHPSTLAPGDTVDLKALLRWGRDVHRNVIPDSMIFADAEAGWAWVDRVGGSPYPDPAAATDSGWVALAQDWAAEGFEVSYTGHYAPGLVVWINGGTGNTGGNGVPFTGVTP